MLNMGDLLKQAREFQEKMGTIQEELAGRTVTGAAGGGMVLATVNGNGELVGVKIEPELLHSGETAMLEDLVTAAVNDGIRKAKELAKSEMARLTGGLNIPGMV